MSISDDPAEELFAIPLSTPVMETIDLGLAHIERMVDRALSHDEPDEPEIFAKLATKSLTEKIADLFPTGYGTEEQNYDRYHWPSVVGLDELRRQATPETVEALAYKWLKKYEWIDVLRYADKNTYPETPGPLQTEMLMAKVVSGLGVYIEGWVGYYLEEEALD